MAFMHVSQMDPETHGGGVAQFARDLKAAVPDLKYYVNPVDWRGVERLNQDDLRVGVFSSDDVVIVDGYYGLGLGGNVKKLIVVCHGTYAGWLRAWTVNPSPKFPKIRDWLFGAAQAQERAFHEADEIVAVSENAALELWEIYRIDAHVIINGVDVERYEPTPDRVSSGLIAEVAGNDERKGSDIIAEIREHRSDLDIRPLGYEGYKWDRWAPFEVALLPSRAEGGQYAALEAMAMNKKIVAHNSGLFRVDVPDEYFIEVRDLHWRALAGACDAALNDYDKLEPREWVLQNATLEGFKKRWRFLLGVEDGD
jgi:glycosyltransferase involved in cell wall biosynthesis